MGINLAIFASGSGSNAEHLVKTFRNTELDVKAFFCNNSKAYVLERAKNLEIPAEVFSRKDFEDKSFLDRLDTYQVDYIILAGFLWKVPRYLIEAYPDKIINIHPALLPKYGGKGMYGSHVHEAVIKHGESESGISIHLVNENYDEGRILHQAKCPVSPSDTPDSLAKKIHQLEYEFFPKVIADYIRERG